jgi:hypothetical protein
VTSDFIDKESVVLLLSFVKVEGKWVNEENEESNGFVSVFFVVNWDAPVAESDGLVLLLLLSKDLLLLLEFELEVAEEKWIDVGNEEANGFFSAVFVLK